MGQKRSGTTATNKTYEGTPPRLSTWGARIKPSTLTVRHPKSTLKIIVEWPFKTRVPPSRPGRSSPPRNRRRSSREDLHPEDDKIFYGNQSPQRTLDLRTWYRYRKSLPCPFTNRGSRATLSAPTSFHLSSENIRPSCHRSPLPHPRFSSTSTQNVTTPVPCPSTRCRHKKYR